MYATEGCDYTLIKITCFPFPVNNIYYSEVSFTFTIMSRNILSNSQWQNEYPD